MEEIKRDDNLRLNYDLNEDSVVFDVGSYIGDWSRNIYLQHKCNIHTFEPIEDYNNQIKLKFKNNYKVKSNNIGLSNETKEIDIYNAEDNSSLYNYFNNNRLLSYTIMLNNSFKR